MLTYWTKGQGVNHRLTTAGIIALLIHTYNTGCTLLYKLKHYICHSMVTVCKIHFLYDVLDKFLCTQGDLRKLQNKRAVHFIKIKSPYWLAANNVSEIYPQDFIILVISMTKATIWKIKSFIFYRALSNLVMENIHLLGRGKCKCETNHLRQLDFYTTTSFQGFTGLKHLDLIKMKI